MEETITDSQKIQAVMEELGISSYRLGQELNLSSGALYHIISGKNNLSINVIDKICTKYPEVNKRYLIKGIGKPLLDNTVSNDTEYIMVKKQDFEQIKQDIATLFELFKKLNKK